MNAARFFILTAVGCVAAVSACNHEQEARSTTITAADMRSVGNLSAVERIADARCARESSCNSVGENKRFANLEACRQKTRGDALSDLNVNDCPGGVAQDDLEACLSAIRAEACGNFLDKIERVTACRKGDLCLSRGTGG